MFIDPLPHDSTLLRSAYFAARVVVMPALLESPGLVGLEGALGGAIVAPPHSSTQEYFGVTASFNPLDELRSRTVGAHNIGVRGALRDRVLTRYTWDQIAKTQIEGYGGCSGLAEPQE